MSTQTDPNNARTVRGTVEQLQDSVQQKIDQKVEDGSKATKTDTNVTNKGSSTAIIDGKAVPAPEGDARTKSSATPPKDVLPKAVME